MSSRCGTICSTQLPTTPSRIKSFPASSTIFTAEDQMLHRWYWSWSRWAREQPNSLHNMHVASIERIARTLLFVGHQRHMKWWMCGCVSFLAHSFFNITSLFDWLQASLGRSDGECSMARVHTSLSLGLGVRLEERRRGESVFRLKRTM